MWFPENLDPILLSHESILPLPRLELMPVLYSSEVPSFSTPSQDTLLYCNDIVYQVGLSHAPMVCGWMMFSELITKVHVSWFTFHLKVLLFHSITNPIKSNFHGFCSFFMVPLMMPSAVKLSVMTSVACCGCPISIRVVLSE